MQKSPSPSYSPDNSPSYSPTSPRSQEREKYSATPEFKIEEHGYLQNCKCMPMCTDLGSCKTFQTTNSDSSPLQHGTHQHAEIDDIGEGESLDLDAMWNEGWSSSDNEDVVVEDIRDELLAVIPADTKDDKVQEKVRQALQDETSSSVELPDPSPANDSPLEPPPEFRMAFRR